jgi:hypothetical protein
VPLLALALRPPSPSTATHFRSRREAAVHQTIQFNRGCAGHTGRIGTIASTVAATGIGTTIAGDMKVAGVTKVVVAAKVSPHNLTAPVRQFVPQGTTTCSVETGAFRNNGKTTLNPPVTVPSVGPSDDIQRYEAPGMAVAPGVLLLIKR